jgi:carboxyl-terminal processing protease
MFKVNLLKTILVTISLIALSPMSSFSATEAEADSQARTEQTNGIPLDDVQRFSTAISEIKKYYVKPVKDGELFDNAIRGMLSGLDPHSSYLNEADYNELQTATNGEFGGLGIEVTMEEGVLKVITPLVGTPAGKAGIKPSDYIIKLGDRSIQGLSLQEAVSIMRGKVGTPINLTIVRKGEKKPLHFDLVREKILIKSVQSKLLDNKYGYIRLTQFQATTDKDMLKAIEKMKSQASGHLQGLILDLRNNPGGLLDAAVQISDAFLDLDQKGHKATIVYTEGRLPGSRFTALSTAGDVLNNAPMIVLINNGSASASEIVAGALKDNKRAVIVGTKSFGKGSVQTVLPLDGKRGIKLTTALYYTPSGSSIQAKGIQPDIVVNEMVIPKSQDENKPSEFSEATLKGHLLVNKPSKEVEEKTLKENDEKLLHDDYQLYTALTILKGLALAQR